MKYTLTPIFRSEKMIIEAHSDIYDDITVSRELHPVGSDKFVIVNPKYETKHSKHLALPLSDCIDLVGSWLKCAENIAYILEETSGTVYPANNMADEIGEDWFN